VDQLYRPRRQRVRPRRSLTTAVTTDTVTVTVIGKTSYQLIAGHHIDPDRNYWRNQNKTPADGRGDL
jgi:hypothetical protein